MTEAEKAKFTAAVVAVASFYGTELNKLALNIYWEALREYELKALDKAMGAHISDPEHGRFMPKPADLIRHLPAKSDQPIGADAAWEMAMRLNIGDEDATVVAPQAILSAFPHALWECGDKIAARMAFKAVFPVVQETYGMGYSVSEGLNPAGREPAIMDALVNNLISPKMAQVLLPHMADEIATLVGPANVPLLTNGDDT